MDVNQLSPQIGTTPSSGDIPAFGAGNSLGSSSREKGFSNVLQDVSHRVEARREVKSRAAQPKTEDRPATSSSTVQQGQSRRSEGSRGTKQRASQSETDNRAGNPTPSVMRHLSHKANGGTDTDPPAAPSDNADQPDPATSNLSIVPVQETSSGTETDSHASQSEPGEETPITGSATDPLLISLVGTTLVTPTSLIDATKPMAMSDTATMDADGSSGLSESSMIQPATPSVEGVARSIVAANMLDDLASQPAASTIGDTAATVSFPTVDQQSDTEHAASDIVDAAPQDKGLLLTAVQGQQIENVDPNQGVSTKWYREEAAGPAQAPSPPIVAQRQDVVAQAAVAATQSTVQDHEKPRAELDQPPVQQLPGKGEPSLHQKHVEVQTPASEAQAVAALAGRMQGEGQGLNSGSDGKGKDDGLKWLSRVDLQAAEMPSRGPEPSTVESGDGGHQYSSFQPGQGGVPSNIRAVATPAAPASPQAAFLTPDPEPTAVSRTHAVQFDMAPADFGQLRVRVVLSDHTIHTHLSTDRAELGQMLTGQQEQLSTQLTAAGLDLGRFQVQVDQERSHQSGQEWPSQAHSGTTQQQRDPRQQDKPHDRPVPLQKRTGVLSLFA